MSGQELDHFDPKIPEPMKKKLKDLADRIHEEFISEFPGAYGCSSVRDIVGVCQSGYIPFQDGGYAVTDYYMGDPLTKAQMEYRVKSDEQCLADFKTEFPDISTDSNEYEQWESEWQEPDVLQAFAYCRNGSIEIGVSQNYKDAPYYREKYAEDIFFECIEEDEFMKWELPCIIEWLNERMIQHTLLKKKEVV